MATSRLRQEPPAPPDYAETGPALVFAIEVTETGRRPADPSDRRPPQASHERPLDDAAEGEVLFDLYPCR